MSKDPVTEKDKENWYPQNQSVIDYFNTKMAAMYQANKELSLDELWKERLGFKQYIKNKKIQIWCKPLLPYRTRRFSVTFPMLQWED